MSKQSLAQIEQAIQSLPPTQRQVIVLRDIEGIDSEEICQILNITDESTCAFAPRSIENLTGASPLPSRIFVQDFGSLKFRVGGMKR